MAPRAQDAAAAAAAATPPANPMRRVDSDTSLSGAEDGPIKTYREYRVKKSKLIG